MIFFLRMFHSCFKLWTGYYYKPHNWCNSCKNRAGFFGFLPFRNMGMWLSHKNTPIFYHYFENQETINGTKHRTTDLIWYQFTEIGFGGFQNEIKIWLPLERKTHMHIHTYIEIDIYRLYAVANMGICLAYFEQGGFNVSYICNANCTVGQVAFVINVFNHSFEETVFIHS